MTSRWRWPAALALALSLGGSACGGGDGDGTSEVQSIVVLHVNFDASAVELHQIEVAAHLANPAMDNRLLFPVSPRPEPIPPGATLAILIPTTRSGLLDLSLTGFDGNHVAVATGNGQTTIAVGDRVDYTVMLMACGSPGC